MGTFKPDHITFRKLLVGDLPLMQNWLNKPHVHEWYEKDKQNTFEEVADRYIPEITGKEPTIGYIVYYEEKPVGYIQYCKVNDYPGFGPYVGYDDATAAVDLFIGEETFMGKGFGSLMLGQFLKNIVFKSNEITTCIIDPEPKNIRAIKSYEKVGFIYIKTIQIPSESDPSYIMELKKENFTR